MNVPADQAIMQDCIDAAVSGVDECLVDDGTYTEKIDFSGKAFTVRSVNGFAVATIDGTSLGDSVAKCVTGEGTGSVLEGFTITGGAGNSALFGGVISGGMLNSGSCPTVINREFVSNSARDGGGMYHRNGGIPVVSNCTFDSNTASGGISDGGAGMRNNGSDAMISRCKNGLLPTPPFANLVIS